MNRNRRLPILSSLSFLTLLLAAGVANAQQERGFFTPPPKSRDGEVSIAAIHPITDLRCRGPINFVTDTAYEGVKTTAYNWSVVGGGGDGARFDTTPVLTTVVNLEPDTCLNAHFSAIAGSRQTYGPGISRIAMFQVTLTPLTSSGGGVPQHMIGHYDTPYGLYGPAVAIEAERDVDTLGANFFQPVGFQGHGDVLPGAYRVDVWWSGGPVGGGGAIGGAFVLKLYQSKPL
jgi:hypothetical protein